MRGKTQNVSRVKEKVFLAAIPAKLRGRGCPSRDKTGSERQFAIMVRSMHAQVLDYSSAQVECTEKRDWKTLILDDFF